MIMESVAPNIFVNDIKATVDYYHNLGFEVTTSVPGENGELMFV